MAKSSMKHPPLAKIRVPATVHVHAPVFEPLLSLSALDTERLSRGNHKVEIGFVTGGCCRNLVRAVIKAGLVTGCEIEPCKDTGGQPIPPELRSLLAKVRKATTSGRQWKPVPIADLVRSQARMLDLIIVGGGCIFICIFNFCLMCCWWPRPHCFVPDIVVGPL